MGVRRQAAARLLRLRKAYPKALSKDETPLRYETRRYEANLGEGAKKAHSYAELVTPKTTEPPVERPATRRAVSRERQIVNDRIEAERSEGIRRKNLYRLR